VPQHSVEVPPPPNRVVPYSPRYCPGSAYCRARRRNDHRENVCNTVVCHAPPRVGGGVNLYSVTTITDAVTSGRRGAQQCAIAWAHDQAVGMGRGSVRSPGEAESSAVEFTAGAHNQGGLRTRPITASELINHVKTRRAAWRGWSRYFEESAATIRTIRVDNAAVVGCTMDPSHSRR